MSTLLTVGQAARYLGVSAASLRKWSDSGLLVAYRTPGGRRRYPLEDLEEFQLSMREAGGKRGRVRPVKSTKP